MLISAIIPCHGGVEDTRRCIEALLAQRDAPALEILVVDNASPDETAQLGGEFAGARVLAQDTNLGFAGGVNRGLAAARGELVLVLNNDTRAAPHMVARMLRGLATDSRIAAIAPVSNHVKGTARIDVGNIGATPEGSAEIDATLGASWSGVLQDTDTLAGLCLLMRRSTLVELGGFDERFGIGNFEDDDLSLRIRLRGRRLVIARDAYLHHEGHRTFDTVGVDYRETLLERKTLFVRKWRDDPAGAAVVAQIEGDDARAQSLAAAALHRHPRWIDGHWLAARARITRGDHAGAQRHFETFLRACPRHGDAHAELAFSMMHSGQRECGIERLAWTLQNCFLSAPSAAEKLCRLGEQATAAGDLADAAAWYRSAVGIRPDDGELHNRLATTLMELGQLAEALESLGEAERLDNPHAATNSGICLWRMGRHAEALQALRRGVERNPEDAVAQQNLAAAVAACSQAIELAAP